MRQVARTYDIIVGTCYCHDTPRSVTGIIQTGAIISFSSNQQIARIGDICVANCGHTAIIATGSDKVFVENKGIAHITDQIVGCVKGIIASGDEKVQAD